MKKFGRKAKIAGLTLLATLGLTGCVERETCNIIINPEDFADVIDKSTNEAVDKVKDEILDKIDEVLKQDENNELAKQMRADYDEIRAIEREITYNRDANGVELLMRLDKVKSSIELYPVEEAVKLFPYLQQDFVERWRYVREQVFRTIPQRAMDKVLDENDYLVWTLVGNNLVDNSKQYYDLSSNTSCRTSIDGECYMYMENGYAYTVDGKNRHEHNDGYITTNPDAPLHVDTEDVSEASNIKRYLSMTISESINYIVEIASERDDAVDINYNNGAYVFTVDQSEDSSRKDITEYSFKVSSDGYLTGVSMNNKTNSDYSFNITIAATDSVSYEKVYTEIVNKVDNIRGLGNTLNTEIAQEAMDYLTRMENTIVEADKENFNFDEIMTDLNSKKVQLFLITDESDRKVVENKFFATQKLAVEKQARYSAYQFVEQDYVTYTNGTDGVLSFAFKEDEGVLDFGDSTQFIKDGNMTVLSNDGGMSVTTLEMTTREMIYQSLVEAQLDIISGEADHNNKLTIIYDNGVLITRCNNTNDNSRIVLTVVYDGYDIQKMTYDNSNEDVVNVTFSQLTKEEYDALDVQAKEKVQPWALNRLASDYEYITSYFTKEDYNETEVLRLTGLYSQELEQLKGYLTTEQYKEHAANIIDLNNTINDKKYAIVYEDENDIFSID